MDKEGYINNDSGNNESNLEKAKKIIKKKKYYRRADCGIYNCRNIEGHDAGTIYKDEDLIIDICYNWSYFEVLGLSDAEFKELERYYDSLAESEEK